MNSFQIITTTLNQKPSKSLHTIFGQSKHTNECEISHYSKCIRSILNLNNTPDMKYTFFTESELCHSTRVDTVDRKTSKRNYNTRMCERFYSARACNDNSPFMYRNHINIADKLCTGPAVKVLKTGMSRSCLWTEACVCVYLFFA